MAPGRQRFGGRLVMIAFGCIGQGVRPLLLRHLDLQPERIEVITPQPGDVALALSRGVHAV